MSMQTLQVNASNGSYAICAGPHLLARAELFLEALSGMAVIVTDTNVDARYGEALARTLRQAGAQVHKLVVPAGEQSKDERTLFDLYDRLLSCGVTRKDTIIALGGGVVGDLAGYAAATLLRGMPFIQAPTTLLAQVDSSVGGKVAVNLPRGKNLVGAFHQPRRVIIDTACLRTLPKEQLACGMGEVIKHAAIADVEMWRQLAQMPRDAFFDQAPDLVLRNCAIKRRFVEEDPFDTGARMMLNFGHTLGHALEADAGYGVLTHGAAVALGMVAACKWGEHMGVTQAGCMQKMQRMLAKYDLPCGLPEDAEALLAKHLAYDKKTMGSDVTLVLLRALGEGTLYKTPRAALCKMLEEI
nr:3-dehydroquinate synthase [Maliibacterium massiliense]